MKQTIYMACIFTLYSINFFIYHLLYLINVRMELFIAVALIVNLNAGNVLISKYIKSVI